MEILISSGACIIMIREMHACSGKCKLYRLIIEGIKYEFFHPNTLPYKWIALEKYKMYPHELHNQIPNLSNYFISSIYR